MDRIEELRALIREALANRSTEADSLDEARSDMSAITAEVEARGADATFTDDEQRRFDERRQTVEQHRTRIAELDEERAEAEAELVALEDEARRNEAARVAAQRYGGPASPVVVPGNEPRTYRQGGEHSFVRDAYRSIFSHDMGASERLGRHLQEERAETRDIGTAAFGDGLVVPQYLTEEYAEVARAGRVFIERARSIPLDDEGMTMTIPRGTTGTTVAAQASENAAVSETDFDETDLVVNVRTFSGQNDLSRQSIERGRGTDAIVLADLAADYGAKVDASAIADDGTSGTHLGILNVGSINAVTYTDASPTVPEFYSKLADAVQRIPSNRLMPADSIFMAPRRWGWIVAALDSSNRPLVLPQALAENAIAVGDPAGLGAVGQMAGLPVFTDPNIPVNLGVGTNEDRVIVARMFDVLFAEEAGAPQRLVFEETAGGNLTVKLVVYGYSAFTAGRYPAGISVISGTGLVTPTF